jgi:hypothetical protein
MKNSKRKRKLIGEKIRGKTTVLPWVGDHPSEVLLG